MHYYRIDAQRAHQALLSTPSMTREENIEQVDLGLPDEIGSVSMNRPSMDSTMENDQHDSGRYIPSSRSTQESILLFAEYFASDEDFYE